MGEARGVREGRAVLDLAAGQRLSGPDVRGAAVGGDEVLGRATGLGDAHLRCEVAQHGPVRADEDQPFGAARHLGEVAGRRLRQRRGAGHEDRRVGVRPRPLELGLAARDVDPDALRLQHPGQGLRAVGGGVAGVEGCRAGRPGSLRDEEERDGEYDGGEDRGDDPRAPPRAGWRGSTGRRPVRGAGRVAASRSGASRAGRAVPLPELRGHERTPVSHTESGSLVPAPAEVRGWRRRAVAAARPAGAAGGQDRLGGVERRVGRAGVRRVLAAGGLRRRTRRRRSGPSCG